MAAAKKTAPLDKKLIAVPTRGPSIRAVLLVWVLCAFPALYGTGWVIYQHYPAPFKAAYKLGNTGVSQAYGAYTGWQKARAAKAAAEEAKRKAAEAESASGSMF